MNGRGFSQGRHFLETPTNTSLDDLDAVQCAGLAGQICLKASRLYGSS